MLWNSEIVRREDGAPHPAFGHPLPARGERALPPSGPSPRLRGEGGAQRRMRGAILTLLLLSFALPLIAQRAPECPVTTRYCAEAGSAWEEPLLTIVRRD